MGAYLSSPVKDKKSIDIIENDKYTCGLSGMQGWRISMEDAYNCDPQIDEDTGFFAVYDGHGGSEVAIYCSHHFVNTLKNTDEYKNGNLEAALKATFLEIDKKLCQPQVIKELKLLSQMEPGDPPLTEEDFKKLEEQERLDKAEVEDETKLLYEEATMSIEDLLAKYGRVANETEQKIKKIHNVEDESKLSAEIIHKEDSDTDDTEVVDFDQSEGVHVDKPSASTAKTEAEEKVKKEDEVEPVETVEGKKKILRKCFPKAKPVKADDEEDDESEDDDYEGFESDEAVEGSSSEDEDLSEDEEDLSNSNNEVSTLNEQKEESVEGDVGKMASGIEEPGADSGTTAVVALLHDNDLYVANAGDSRCVLCRKGGVAYDMSDDHKPEDEAEHARITAAGGHVNKQGRVNGGLNLSRAIGDHLYKTNVDLPLEKQMISALPDVRHVRLEPDDDFMVIACDGIWNVLDSQEVVDFVRARLHPEKQEDDVNSINQLKLSTICEELFEKCLAPDTCGDGTGCDNMTCIIVHFNQKWVAERHQERGPLNKEHSSLSVLQDEKENVEKLNDEEHILNAKGDSIESGIDQKLMNCHSIDQSAQENNKRPLDVANDESCVNGESPSVKRAKLEHEA